MSFRGVGSASGPERRIDPDRLVLVLDLPGYRGSPLLGRCDPEDVAAAVASAAADARVDHPVIVGHSISAIVATVYGMNYPTRGVVNVDRYRPRRQSE
jgi:pimeloyl-ACP methyl ester carboxylesterase